MITQSFDWSWPLNCSLGEWGKRVDWVDEQLSTKTGLFLAKVVAILALLLGAVFLHRMAGFSARCYSSQIIDRLVLFSERQEVPNCRRAFTDLALGAKLADTSTDKWARWTPALDRLLDVWPTAPKGMAVVIVNEEPYALYHEGQHLLLGGTWAKSQRLWSNLVATAWLEQVSQGMIALERNVLGEFLVSMAEGQHQMVGLSLKVVPEGEINWESITQSKSEYCQSPWRRPEELDNCSAEEGENFRPLLSRGLWLIYQEANWRGRRELMTWLTEKVARGEEPMLAAKPDDDNSIEWMKSELERWIKKAQLSDNQIFSQSLWLKLGLIQAEKPYVVIESEIPDSLILRSHEALLFRAETQQTWVGTGGRNVPPTTEFKPQHLVKVACKKPSLDQLEDLADSTVLFILACDPSVLKGWDFLSQRQIKAFIAENPEQPMIWLNVAGLRRTLIDQPTVATSKPVSLKRLRRMSNWKEDLWDKASKAFVPRAAIDLVLSHRASRELL